MNPIKNIAWISSLLLLAGCGASSDGNDPAGDGGTINSASPSDSSGGQGTVTVAFGATSGAALALAEDAAPTVKIGESIVIDKALLNIAKIKIKTDATPSDEEKALDQKEAEEEKVAAAEAEKAVPTALAGKPEDAAKPDGKGPDKDELATKEHERLEREAKSDKATKFKGPYVFDAVTGKLEGDVPAVSVADGSYRRIEFQLKRSYDERMLGDVMAIHGTVMKDGAAVPFTIDWHVALNFRLSGTSAFQVTNGENNALAVRLDLAPWFDGIDLTKATVDADGTIHVDKTSNHEIMKQLHKNMKASCRFGKDRNGDGKLGSDEEAGKGQETVDASAE